MIDVYKSNRIQGIFVEVLVQNNLPVNYSTVIIKILSPDLDGDLSIPNVQQFNNKIIKDFIVAIYNDKKLSVHIKLAVTRYYIPYIREFR